MEVYWGLSMKFKCSLCGGYNTFVENVYHENDIGVCFDCKRFFKMGRAEINWANVRNFIILVTLGMSLLYFIGVLK